MSARNGDRARSDRERKKKVLRRARTAKVLKKLVLRKSDIHSNETKAQESES